MPKPKAVVFDLKSRDDVCIELSLYERCYLIAVLRGRVNDHYAFTESERKVCAMLIEKLMPRGH